MSTRTWDAFRTLGKESPITAEDWIVLINWQREQILPQLENMSLWKLPDLERRREFMVANVRRTRESIFPRSEQILKSIKITPSTFDLQTQGIFFTNIESISGRSIGVEVEDLGGLIHTIKFWGLLRSGVWVRGEIFQRAHKPSDGTDWRYFTDEVEVTEVEPAALLEEGWFLPNKIFLGLDVVVDNWVHRRKVQLEDVERIHSDFGEIHSAIRAIDSRYAPGL